jgi:tetratricopeptide (TPR) repeat protein
MPNVRLQRLRDFTVQIRRLADGQIVGTGIAASIDGKVITCAHVVEAAGVSARDLGKAEIGVYFPQARPGAAKTRRAMLAARFAKYDDDVVLLQLLDGPAPLAPEQFPVFDAAEEPWGHAFQSYGYRRLDAYVAGLADGEIQGEVEPPPGRYVQADPVQLKSSQINSGMSGSAVLDEARNLVVGIVSETWFPDPSTKDRDTAWAINARVLSLDPLNVSLHEEPLPLASAIRPVPEPTSAPGRGPLEPALASAPLPIAEWVGREDLLAALDIDWTDAEHRITGLIGLGGEGKSTLARHWVDRLLKDKARARPDGVFWWTFSERQGIEEFMEAALTYLSDGRIDLGMYRSANARIHLLAAMILGMRLVLVLDGMEAVQHQDGDQFGSFQAAELREFLGYLAAEEHGSLCLITSRVPLLDLMEYTTHRDRDVDRLTPHDGRALLRKLGVKGSDEALDQVVAEWDGHALTLSLVASYLTIHHGGDVGSLEVIPTSPTALPPSLRIDRILAAYEEHLGDQERGFLLALSAFRRPAPQALLAMLMGFTSARTDSSVLDEQTMEPMVKRLVNYRLLRTSSDGYHTMHPLVRAHYLTELTRREDLATRLHSAIGDWYARTAPHTPPTTLDDFSPLIEAIHHLTQAGRYDDALAVYWQRIAQGGRFALVNQFGAWRRELLTLQDFFPGGNTRSEPALAFDDAIIVLNEIGMCLMTLGRLHEAAGFFERTTQLLLGAGKSAAASRAGRTYGNLASLHLYLGDLEKAGEAAGSALEFASQPQEYFPMLACLGWVAHLRGDLDEASRQFAAAEKEQHQLDPTFPHLISLSGVWHAKYLRRIGERDRARSVTDKNLEVCEREGWRALVGLCHTLIGDLDCDEGDVNGARVHYEHGLRLARSLSHKPSLIEALRGRGRWHVVRDQAKDAQIDLEEALVHATDDGYRIYEADARVSLSDALRAGHDDQGAREQAEHAHRLSEEIGYHWGQLDAAALLAHARAK